MPERRNQATAPELLIDWRDCDPLVEQARIVAPTDVAKIFVHPL
jgi:hypothetical protein